MNKIIVGFALLSSCTTPITKAEWDRCESLCESREGVMEMCSEPFRGIGCHCNDDKIFWYDQL